MKKIFTILLTCGIFGLSNASTLGLQPDAAVAQSSSQNSQNNLTNLTNLSNNKTNLNISVFTIESNKNKYNNWNYLIDSNNDIKLGNITSKLSAEKISKKLINNGFSQVNTTSVNLMELTSQTSFLHRVINESGQITLTPSNIYTGFSILTNNSETVKNQTIFDFSYNYSGINDIIANKFGDNTIQSPSINNSLFQQTGIILDKEQTYLYGIQYLLSNNKYETVVVVVSQQ